MLRKMLGIFFLGGLIIGFMLMFYQLKSGIIIAFLAFASKLLLNNLEKNRGRG